MPQDTGVGRNVVWTVWTSPAYGGSGSRPSGCSPRSLSRVFLRRVLAYDASAGVLALFAVGDVYVSLCKKALTLHLVRGEGRERYIGCNLMQRKALASSHQHLMAEAPVAGVPVAAMYRAQARQLAPTLPGARTP